jgi:hypothetical protein
MEKRKKNDAAFIHRVAPTAAWEDERRRRTPTPSRCAPTKMKTAAWNPPCSSPRVIRRRVTVLVRVEKNSDEDEERTRGRGWLDQHESWLILRKPSLGGDPLDDEGRDGRTPYLPWQRSTPTGMKSQVACEADWQRRKGKSMSMTLNQHQKGCFNKLCWKNNVSPHPSTQQHYNAPSSSINPVLF